ncbi:MAG: hypothetical protein JW866_03285, partial [Ignavibacteriales bacterium]|nr:hypothetical protein [Ignavibacteriales bacterium]
GGEWAYNNLNERCKARGIRLASDMVPNHTGIYSDWIINHPDYFIQLDYPPFPNYSFNGPNLSEHPDIEIRIEDGYWNKTDASVVFQRIDKRYGDVKYIYHGNDGTSMPWNDTAQLNMLKKEVREAVIGKIFEVARKFSIIRFDAAMTLTKRHFSRLWFPPPGSGGDIPSRSDYGLTKEEFDAFFPEEFWREVVDKINSELPNTLLLAEAFWLLEGYFVRTLGMHRVYNSAFMNMLMREENSKYRDLITNTLEFEPEILKRYVNFMSNPDEETAIKQFGTGDKYFGIVTMMVTLPGLPMFAHGQIEGFTEKYGMEYKRAYYNETPQQWLVEQHQSEIFPLVGKRYLFSQVDNFWFYDFLNDNGHINENVFAYTNAAFGDKALILFNNKYEDTSGKIDFSTPKLTTQNGNKNLLAIKLADALEIKADNNFFYIYHELKTGLEYIREGKDFHHYGYHTHLKAFEYKVFLSFRELYDTTGELRKLYQQLNGQGVPNISNSIEELRLKPIHIEFEKVLSPQTIKSGYGSLIKLKDQFDDTKSELINAFGKLQTEITNYYKINESQSELKEELIRDFLKIESLNKILQQDFPSEKNIFNKKLNKSVQLSIGVNYRENMLIAGILFLCKQIKEIFSDNENLKNIWFDLLMLSIPIKNILSRLGRSNNDIENDITLIKILLEFDFEVFDVRNIRVTNNNKITKTFIDQMLFENKLDEFEKLLENDFVKNYININYHEGIMYYSKELFENLVDWLFTLSLLNYFEIPKTENKKTTKATISAKEKPSLIKLTFEIVKHIKQISVDSKYQMEVLIYKLTHV